MSDNRTITPTYQTLQLRTLLLDQRTLLLSLPGGSLPPLHSLSPPLATPLSTMSNPSTVQVNVGSTTDTNEDTLKIDRKEVRGLRTLWEMLEKEEDERM